MKKYFKNILIVLSSFLLLLTSAPFEKEKVNAAPRTKTITEYWTSDWVNSTGEVNEPSTIKGRYYDSKTGQYVDYTAKKSGGLYEIDHKIGWDYYTSYGRAENYDKENNNYLGFMSNNSSTYYAGRWTDSEPGEAPDRYYGDPFYLGLRDWELIDYGWDEPKVVNADDWASKGSSYRSKLVYSNGSYWWRSENGVLNKYRRGVWIKYRVKINLFKYRQKYTVTVTLPDNDPPEHTEHEITSHKYKNGNDYWTTPGDTVRIRLRGSDPESYLHRTYIRLQGNNQDEIAYLTYPSSFTDWSSYNSTHVDVTGASKTYESPGHWTKETTFNVKGVTHGHSYNVKVQHRDNAGNYTGYIDTGMNLRIDGVNPNHVQDTYSSYGFKDGNTYWIKPNETMKVHFRANDSDSGLQFTSISLGGGSVREMATHYWNSTSTNLDKTHDTKPDFDVLYPTSRPYVSGSTKEVAFEVKGYEHGKTASVRYRYADNVGNANGGATGYDVYGWSNVASYISVDGEAPTVSFSSFEQGWTEGSISIHTTISDEHSGVKRFRYRTQNGDTWSSYSSWISADNRTFTVDDVGRNRIHIQAEDNVGNTKDYYSGYYYINNSPIANFEYAPNPAFEGDDLTITNLSTDPDGHNMTARWVVIDPEGNASSYSNWDLQLSNVEPGSYYVNLTVTDEYGGEDMITKEIFVDSLTIIGKVQHTDAWLEKHQALGHIEKQFYSGETFRLSGEVSTKREVDKVTVDLMGERINNQEYEALINLDKASSSMWGKDFTDLSLLDPDIRFKNGPVYFVFKAYYANGFIAADIVEIEIIGSAYEFFQIRRMH